MEEENRKLGELTLEEFAAIFETSAKIRNLRVVLEEIN